MMEFKKNTVYFICWVFHVYLVYYPYDNCVSPSPQGEFKESSEMLWSFIESLNPLACHLWEGIIFEDGCARNCILLSGFYFFAGLFFIAFYILLQIS